MDNPQTFKVEFEVTASQLRFLLELRSPIFCITESEQEALDNFRAGLKAAKPQEAADV